MIEYDERHFPGNPSLLLEHWTEDLPFSEAAKEKFASKDVLHCPHCGDFCHEGFIELENGQRIHLTCNETQGDRTK